MRIGVTFHYFSEFYIGLDKLYSGVGHGCGGSILGEIEIWGWFGFGAFFLGGNCEIGARLGFGFRGIYMQGLVQIRGNI